ncbi:MAG TPA: hypothetical protein VMW10_11990 [Alphaproteobacteria bacterium]|nr:hypothetical protein [Alphaproteobacteria bacterium]
MWIKLKREYQGNPKGTIMNLGEQTANRLTSCKNAMNCEAPETPATKSIYFPKTNIDKGEVAIVDAINGMIRSELLEFIEDNNLDVALDILVNPEETNKIKQFRKIKILANLRTEVAEAAIQAGLRFELDDNIIPKKPNRGSDKMMRSSPVEK